jgi:hypothetical protein
MKRAFSIIFVLLICATFLTRPANALRQTSPYVFDTTIPVDGGVRADIDAWLATDNPSIGTYYAITYARADGVDWIVCIVAMNLDSPDEDWSLTENAQGESKLIWLGTVRVYSDHSVELLTDPQEGTAGFSRLAAPLLPAPGGGPSIRWPFQIGKTVMYGPRGVHNAGYSSYGTDMKALDLVSGSDMGSGAANDQVFASWGGDVDYVCEDGTSTTIRVNDEAGNKFIYAHMVDNAALEVDHTFNKGDVIATLVHGTFDDDCGYADQQPNHWHLHWGFEPANNAYTVEGCVINTNTASIRCGDKTINTGSFITGMGGTPGYDDGRSSTPTFWDYLLVGFISIFDRGILKLLPEHSSPTLLPLTILTTIRFVLRLTYVLLISNFNMGPAMAALFLALAFRFIVVGAIYLVFVFLRTAKAIPGL